MQIVSNKDYRVYWLLGVLNISFAIIYIYFTLKPSIFIWDEASYGLNSIEMSRSNNLLTPTIDYIPSTENTKPTLVLALQALSIKIFGINELAIRLPTILFSLLLIVLLFYYLAKFKVNIIAITITNIIFISSGFYSHHIAFTGDLDAIFSFFTTFMGLYFYYLFFYKEKVTNKEFLILYILSLLAFFSKSFATFLIIMPLLLFLVLFKINLYSKYFKQFIVVSLLFIVVIFTYYQLREISNTGNLNRVFTTEISRYFKNVMPWHQQPFLFYIKNLFINRLYPWLYFLPILIYFFVIKLKNKENFFFIFSCFISFFFLLFISIPKVKLEWYDAPVFPWLCIALGYSLYFVIESFKSYIPIVYLTFFCIATFAIKLQYNKFEKIINTDNLETNGTILNKNSTLFPNTKKYKVLMNVDYPSHYDQLKFYIAKLYFEKNITTTIITNINQINVGDTVITNQINKSNISNKNYKIINSYLNGYTFTTN